MYNIEFNVYKRKCVRSTGKVHTVKEQKCSELIETRALTKQTRTNFNKYIYLPFNMPNC